MQNPHVIVSGCGEELDGRCLRRLGLGREAIVVVRPVEWAFFFFGPFLFFFCGTRVVDIGSREGTLEDRHPVET